MRILAITPTFFPIVGGAELLIRDVGNVWSDAHELRLLTRTLPQASEAFWADDGAHEATCRFEVNRFEDSVCTLDMRGHRLVRGLIPPMSLTAVNRLADEIDRMRPDLLVGFFGIPYGLPLAIASARFGVPYALVLCGDDLPSPRTKPVPLWNSYQRLAASRASRVVYVSRSCFDSLFPGREFDPEHDSVVHGAIDLARVNRGGGAAVRGKLGIGDEETMLLTVSRLGPEKRVDVVLRAFAEVPPTRNRMRLVIAGQGPERGRLERLARELGIDDRVTFAGHLDAEKDAFYEACDIFVFHSLFETFGQVAVEAMAHGKPVVSVRAGAIPEVVADRVTGLLGEVGDARSIAEPLARLANDGPLRRAMGIAARERVERMFDWDRIRGAWAEVPALATGAKRVAARGAALTEAGMR
jgi:glycosyltransferase involved in cell wall biosynthesis